MELLVNTRHTQFHSSQSNGHEAKFLAKATSNGYLVEEDLGLVSMLVARPPDSSGNVGATKWNLHFH